MRIKISVLACLAATILLGTAPADARARRSGRSEFLIGIGSMTSQEATIYDSVSLDAGDGTALSFRFRHHFNSNVGFEFELASESDTADLKYRGVTYDSADADTSYWFINILLHLMETPIAPYIVAGVGRFNHDADLYGWEIDEGGSALDVGVGVDGRFSRNLVWVFEAKMLSYEFEDFREDWNRFLFSGHIGFRF